VGFSENEEKLKHRIVFTPDYGIYKVELIVELFRSIAVVMC